MKHILSTDFRKILRYPISRKSIPWEQSCSMRTDGQMWGSSNSRFSQSCGTRLKTCPGATLSTTKLTRSNVGSNPDIRDDTTDKAPEPRHGLEEAYLNSTLKFQLLPHSKSSPSPLQRAVNAVRQTTAVYRPEPWGTKFRIFTTDTYKRLPQRFKGLYISS
jgi:hypothetical protein